MRYLGLIFFKDDDSGIAKINVTDNVTGLKLLDNKLVDLFQKDQDADPGGKYEEFILWVTLPLDDANRYAWTVAHNGTHNAAAVGPNYDINFMGYTVEQPLIKAHTVPQVVLVDRVNALEYPFESGITIKEYSYALIKEQTKKLYLSTIHYADGITNSYKVGSDELIVYSFSRFSVDDGVTWKYPYDLSIIWGSSAGSTDESISSAGIFYVEFVDILPTNTKIIFDVLPVFDTVRVEMTLNQPSDTDGFIDYNTPFCVQEYAAEFKI